MDGWIFRFLLLSTLLFSWALLPSQIYGIGDTHLCSTPLGMQSNEILDSFITASSFYVNSVGPTFGRLNNEKSAWCPKEPISAGTREWLQVSFNTTHLISGVQIQGRHAKGHGQEFTEEFEVEYWREGLQMWRKYYRFDGKSVFTGNSDTNTIVTAKFRPPLFARWIRILPYSKGVRTVCIRVELLGCVLKSGVLQYTVEQGSTFSEGVSLRDDSYDGQKGSKWDRGVEPQRGDNNGNAVSLNSFQIIHRPEPSNVDLDLTENYDGESTGPEILTGGLGKLTDTIEGANSFTMDIGYGLGNGWVGWKKEAKDWLEVLFEFEHLRKFSSINVFSNNFPSKGVQVFSRAKVYFSVGGVYFNGKAVTYVPTADVVADYARNFTIDFTNQERVARFIKIHFYYRTSWIVLGEFYFNGEIYEGNYTEELRPDVQLDFPDTQSPLEIGDLDSSMETVVGIITGLFLLVGIVTGVIIWMRRNGRNISSAFHFHGGGGGAFPLPWRTNWNSVPTHIVTQTNPTTEGVKDLLLNLTPLRNGGGGTVVVNGDFSKAHNPPPYTNGTVSTKHSNGLQLQGTQLNNYGSTKRLAEPGRKAVVDSSTNGSAGHHGSPTKVTLRTNQLAALDENADYGEGDNENIYHEACTINNSTKNRNKKIKVSSSVWNLSSGGRSYRNRGRLVPEVSLRQLRLIENLGSCLHGQVHLYDFEGEIACHDGTLYRNCRLIAKTIKNLAEIRLLSLLDHEHVLETVALCSEMKQPLLAIYIAPECGDLCSFLSRLTNTPSLNWLLSTGAQIASGMNYLESLSLIHRDLAARNCVLCVTGVRIGDLAMACEQYRDDYCQTPRGLAPLRWWSWESILSEDFTMTSSVWSFGVTLWEILTLCRQKPLAHIEDHQITTLAEKYGSTATSSVWLPQPLLSPPEIFDLMRECWQVNPTARPTFFNIHLFLDKYKCNTSIYHAVC